MAHPYRPYSGPYPPASGGGYGQYPPGSGAPYNMHPAPAGPYPPMNPGAPGTYSNMPPPGTGMSYPPSGPGGYSMPHHTPPHGGMYSSFQDQRMQSSIARSFFVRADRDRNGTLDPKEFHTVLSDLGLPMNYQECLNLFGSVDSNRTGRISEREFVDFYANYVARNIPQQGAPFGAPGVYPPGAPGAQHGFYTEERNQRNIARAVFYDADRDRNGMLDRGEFGNILMKFGMAPSPQHAMQLFDTADISRNGYLNLQEFEIFYINFCRQYGRTFFA